MHLPVVKFLTFYLAHLDRQGCLAACFVTGALGIVTYRYLVRYTPLGTLLNGKRVRENAGQEPR